MLGSINLPSYNVVQHQVDVSFGSRIRIRSLYSFSILFFAVMTMIFASCTGESVHSEIYHVKSTADPGGDGTSWEKAFTHPQDALDIATSGDQIWIAEGVYGPREVDDRNVIVLKAGALVLGGFTGTENDAGERNPETAITVLDGQCSAYHVVLAIRADGAVLDGFTITNGRATGIGIESPHGGMFNGGGMFNAFSSPEIRRCRFIDNSASYKGGAVYNEDSAPLMVECTFEKNSANFGGAISSYNSSSTIINSIFRDNGSYVSGGAVTSIAGSPTFVNCVFSGNWTNQTGGAVLSNSSSATFTNCTFNGNRSREKPGGGVSSYMGDALLINCILWGDLSADASEIWSDNGEIEIIYSIVQGGYEGSGNLDLRPDFVQEGIWDGTGSWIDGDYRLTAGSAAIDSGTAGGAPNFDLSGKLRPQLLAHDRGAYEYAAQ